VTSKRSIAGFFVHFNQRSNMAKRKKDDAEKAPEVEETGGTVEAPETEAGPVDQPNAVPDSVAQELSKLKQAHYDQICLLNEQCLAAGYEYEDKKSEANHAKKRYELLQNKLNSLIAQGANPQRELPFSDPEEVAPEAWKDTPLSDAIELTEKQREKLEDIGVKTVGQFEHLRSGQMDGFPDGLRSVKGVGEKTVDAWEDQIVNWLGVNTREAEPVAEAAGTTEGADNDAGTLEEEI